MKIQFHRIDTNVVVGLLVREFCCSGTDVSAKVLAMYAGTRTPPMEPQWLAAGLSQRMFLYLVAFIFVFSLRPLSFVLHCSIRKRKASMILDRGFLQCRKKLSYLEQVL